MSPQVRLVTDLKHFKVSTTILHTGVYETMVFPKVGGYTNWSECECVRQDNWKAAMQDHMHLVEQFLDENDRLEKGKTDEDE